MQSIKMFSGENFPLETHKVKVIQKINLIPIEERLKAIQEAGCNTFLLKNRDVFLDMLTDSGVNAMSDRQIAAMMVADDSYAGSESFYRFENAVQHFFGKKYVLPVHQGRAAENIITRAMVKAGDIIPMNYHFTTAKAHLEYNGASVVELLTPEGLEIANDAPFKGNVNIPELRKFISETGADKVPYIRLEAGTNLIGGQPFSLENAREVRKVADEFGVYIVLDASLLAENLYFIKKREPGCEKMSLHDIALELSKVADVIYFSARKLGLARGGGICTNNPELYNQMKELVPLFEGFLTYGGMSVREVEAAAVGLQECLDETVVGQSIQFIEYMVDELKKLGIPVVTPAGCLGCHVNAGAFVDHIPSTQYPAGALAAAYYLVSGARGMERGTLSEGRDENGHEIIADMELLRLALPRRVFTLSQVKYAVDRLHWLYQNRHLIGGLEFSDEPKILRFFLGKLKPISHWQEDLVKKFREDFGDSL